MKYWVWVIIIATACVSLHSEILYQQDFTGVSSFESIGWTEYDTATLGNWSISNSSYASGSSPEARYHRSSSSYAESRLTSPAIPVTDADDAIISFKEHLSYMSMGYSLTLEMETKYDNGGWITRWSQYTTSSHASPSINLSLAGVDTLRVRFVLTGNAENTCDWYIDNIQLREADVYITDEIWTITENTVISSDRMLYVSGDSEIRLEGAATLTIEGGVEIIGTEDNPVEISLGHDNPSFAGLIVLVNPNMPCTFSNCHFKDKLDSPHLIGGAVCANDVQHLTFDSCLFDGLIIPGYGGGVIAYNSSIGFNDCEFIDCVASQGGAISAEHCDIDMTGGAISGCVGSNRAAAVFCENSTCDMERVEITGCGLSVTGKSILHFNNLNTVNLDHLTIAGCDVGTRGVVTIGDSTTANISNSIIWNNNNDSAFYAGNATSVFSIKYVDHNGSYYSTGGSTINTNHVIHDNPLFTDAANGDYTLTEDSPCIDVGDPDYLPLDPDMTITDLGCYPFFQANPVITNLADIPDDQGRQLQCVWRACLYDSTYTQAQYYVWREDEIFDRDGGIFISSVSQLADLADAQPDVPVYMTRDDVVWCWVATLPGLCRDFYSCIVPTLADSCVASANETSCMVTYANAERFWDSESVASYSLDNIPPMSPEQVELTRNGNAFELTWSEVTDGELNGNTYPEQNGVWYRVYAGDTPVFPTDETTLVAVTQNLSFLWSGDAERKYFRIVTVDQN